MHNGQNISVTFSIIFSEAVPTSLVIAGIGIIVSTMVEASPPSKPRNYVSVYAICISSGKLS